MAAENRIVVGLPGRYEAAKTALREYEQRVGKALIYANSLPESETKTALVSVLLGYNDDSV